MDENDLLFYEKVLQMKRFSTFLYAWKRNEMKRKLFLPTRIEVNSSLSFIHHLQPSWSDKHIYWLFHYVFVFEFMVTHCDCAIKRFLIAPLKDSSTIQNKNRKWYTATFQEGPQFKNIINQLLIQKIFVKQLASKFKQ